MSKKKNTILIVDSDPQNQKLMTIILDREDFKLVECSKGRQAVNLAFTTKPDLVLLDLNLPDMQGIDVITALREWSEVPIIILSANVQDRDVVEALNKGANDYVFKPFSADVLLARINASLRTAATQEAGLPILINGPLVIDLVRHEVFLHDKLIPFTPKEYNLLRYLMVHRGKMLTHREILKAIWGDAHADDTQYLRVFIAQIRAKLGTNNPSPVLIMTEPGVGYRMEVAEIVPYHEKGLLRLAG